MSRQDAKIQLCGGALLVSVLLVGSAGAQGAPETALPMAPSAVRQIEALVPVALFPLTGGPPQEQQTNSSQSQDPDRGFVAAIKRGAKDQKEIYSAPFHRKNLKWDALFLLATGGLIASDKHIAGAISHDNLSVSQHISDIGLYSTVATTGVMLASGILNKNEHARETGLLGFEAFANTFAVGAVTQLIAGRERPLEGAGQGRFWVNNVPDSSFPSQHSGLTWSMASVLAHEYPKPWVQFLAYGTATTVSVTRVTGLKHFPADVAVGGVFGYLIGQHIFHSHSRFLHPHRGQKV
ncbi:MAG TPA: phosphatase PAP2 family protein [Terriglobales bacterium]|nr:phosphatase PAP2 family protein [Terriglobales bacterium]